MKEEHRFALEFERFKQKANWENKLFYTFLTLFIGSLTFSFKNGNFLGLKFIWWAGILALFLIIGEFLVHKYLEKQKGEILGKFK